MISNSFNYMVKYINNIKRQHKLIKKLEMAHEELNIKTN
jgi:hypothetical protein